MAIYVTGDIFSGGWISGHYHIDKAASYKDLCIYERILQIL